MVLNLKDKACITEELKLGELISFKTSEMFSNFYLPLSGAVPPGSKVLVICTRFCFWLPSCFGVYLFSLYLIAHLVEMKAWCLLNVRLPGNVVQRPPHTASLCRWLSCSRTPQFLYYPPVGSAWRCESWPKYSPVTISFNLHNSFEKWGQCDSFRGWKLEAWRA